MLGGENKRGVLLNPASLTAGCGKQMAILGCTKGDLIQDKLGRQPIVEFLQEYKSELQPVGSVLRIGLEPGIVLCPIPSGGGTSQAASGKSGFHALIDFGKTKQGEDVLAVLDPCARILVLFSGELWYFDTRWIEL